MKKIIFALMFASFVGPMAYNAVASNQGTKIEVRDDDKKKKKKKKKSSCCTSTNAATTGEKKSCCTKH